MGESLVFLQPLKTHVHITCLPSDEAISLLKLISKSSLELNPAPRAPELGYTR